MVSSFLMACDELILTKTTSRGDACQHRHAWVTERLRRRALFFKRPITTGTSQNSYASQKAKWQAKVQAGKKCAWSHPVPRRLNGAQQSLPATMSSERGLHVRLWRCDWQVKNCCDAVNEASTEQVTSATVRRHGDWERADGLAGALSCWWRQGHSLASLMPEIGPSCLWNRADCGPQPNGYPHWTPEPNAKDCETLLQQRPGNGTVALHALRSALPSSINGATDDLIVRRVYYHVVKVKYCAELGYAQAAGQGGESAVERQLLHHETEVVRNPNNMPQLLAMRKTRSELLE
ncbi:hypothetical protein NDU88_001260 [Pleurodeles waltl]|uniref:Uncharacterized protein n=1 Tax=Pleurodeles waltl TaxID=8319 RepID=A0AAV7KP33_PLEWA|nr:hypothetical protein NDU88_001260 [Pleurodeles waltl]